MIIVQFLASEDRKRKRKREEGFNMTSSMYVRSMNEVLVEHGRKLLVLPGRVCKDPVSEVTHLNVCNLKRNFYKWSEREGHLGFLADLFTL